MKFKFFSSEKKNNKNNEYAKLEESLGYKFKDKSKLERALTHRSLHQKGVNDDYERSEFLGDAVLDLVIGDLLLKKHKNASEGDLSKLRAALVNYKSLAKIACKLNIGDYVKLSKAEKANNGQEKPSILSDVVEAIIGAIYYEAGFEVVFDVIKKLFEDEFKCVKPFDPKTELQEILHATTTDVAEYKLVDAKGPEHARIFITEVCIGGKSLGRGKGTTKKESQQNAAKEALEYFKKKSVKE
ncbi:MAG: ribonuclease III [Bdellovibrionota bacterium]